MLSNVILDQLAHQAVERTACTGDLLQHRGAVGILIDRFLDRRHLSRDPANPRHQPGLVLLKVSHSIPPYTIFPP